MTVVLDGVPIALPRDRVCEAIRVLGIDPDLVLGLRMEPRSIEVDTCALDADGHKYVTDGQIALRTIRVRIDPRIDLTKHP